MLSSCIMFKANFEVTQAARHISVDRNEDPETKLAVKDKRPGFQFAVGSLYRKSNKTQLLHTVDMFLHFPQLSLQKIMRVKESNLGNPMRCTAV